MNNKPNLWDKLILTLDQAVRTLGNNPKTSGQPYPASDKTENMGIEESNHAAALMRINHTGEICAQGLYHGQALVSRTPEMQVQMQEAALEEGDHLAWCQQRIDELGSHTSYLNPLWYTGSLCIGLLAGMIGDKWSLGFVVETERQVILHLEKHLQALPEQDGISRQILERMEIDEAAHRDQAIASGAKELPDTIKKAMSLVSKIMVKTTYWI